MSNITIKNLDQKLKNILCEKAIANKRSIEEEIQYLLSKSLNIKPEAPENCSASISTGSLLNASKNLTKTEALAGKQILLIISGGIAAYKSVELIRRLREQGASVCVIMTSSSQKFITEMLVAAISGNKVFTDLFDAQSEHDVGHINLSRNCDIVVVAPATADFMAKMAGGHADDLATAVLLATKAPVVLAPAMNPSMWTHTATQNNLEKLLERGINFIGPMYGEMAENNEAGIGRMAEPCKIAELIACLILDKQQTGKLSGKHVIVTSGPTHEPIDPVRYLANYSSGKQGHEIARALVDAGAKVTLISGPVNIPDPVDCSVIHVLTALEMLQAVIDSFPADIAVMVAAVVDWRPEEISKNKIKKTQSKYKTNLNLIQNPDILKTVANHKQRPRLVIGFAAETSDVIPQAVYKLKNKKADWILGNNISQKTGIMGGELNTVTLVSHAGIEEWPTLTKAQVAKKLVDKITKYIL